MTTSLGTKTPTSRRTGGIRDGLEGARRKDIANSNATRKGGAFIFATCFALVSEWLAQCMQPFATRPFFSNLQFTDRVGRLRRAGLRLGVHMLHRGLSDTRSPP